MTLRLNKVRAVVKVYMFMQDIIKLSVAVHMLSYLAMVNEKSENPVL